MSGNWTGIPFDPKGLTRAGCHCWGLVRLVLAEECGIAVPAYGETGAGDTLAVARAFRDACAAGPWTRTDAPRRHDVVTMRSATSSVPWHAGIMMDETRLLHVEAATGSVIVALTHPAVARRITGFWRHAALA